MRAGDEGWVGGLGKEGILVDLYVLRTEILDQSRMTITAVAVRALDLE